MEAHGIEFRESIDNFHKADYRIASQVDVDCGDWRAEVRRLAAPTLGARWQRSPRNSFSSDRCPVSVWYDERWLHLLFIHVSAARRLYARGGRGQLGPGGHTYYVINPRPPPAPPRLLAECGVSCRVSPGPPSRGSAGRAVLLAPGFLVPAPHGHSLRTELRVVTSAAARAAASRVATRAAVALRSRLYRDALVISFMLISAR